MKNQTDLYCKIFIDSTASRNDLVNDVALLFSGTAERATVYTQLGDIDVRENKDFDEELRSDADDGFLHYRFFVDVDPKPARGLDGAVLLISKMLEHFWSNGFRAVASCDYEDSLPNNGGYKMESTLSAKS